MTSSSFDGRPATGKPKENTVPLPEFDFAVSTPPCPPMIERQIDSPTPMQGRQPSWLSPMANVIHAPAIDRQHLGRDEAGIRLDQESHGGGNVLRRANPTDHGALAH